MANYNLTQTGDEVQAYIDSIPVIDVTGTLNGSAITFGSNPYSQIAANYAADCGSVIRLTVGTAVYLLRVNQYDGTNFTASEMSGAHNVVATIGSSSASATIDVGIDATPTQGSDNLVKSGGVYDEVSQLHQKVIYDVSANNDRATFASLSALLTSKNLSTLIPIAVRCGGMSIRFVQSSDNKYVCYMLTKDEWSNIDSDWEKINLEVELQGKRILSYSGLQAIVTIQELTADTDAVIKFTGNVEDINHIAFMHDDGTPHTLATFYCYGMNEYYMTIPSTTNRIGIYEKTGKTLAITCEVRTIGLVQEVSEECKDLSLKNEGDVTGLYYAKGVDKLTASAKMFIDAIKFAGFYDPSSAEKIYVRLAGFYSTYIQVSLTYDHTTMIDFMENASERPTGLHTYKLSNNGKILQLVIDWDKFTGNYADTASEVFYIYNSSYREIVLPLQNNVNTLNDEVNVLKNQIQIQQDTLGEGVGASVFNSNVIFCPNKKASFDGIVTEVFLQANADTVATIYIGEVDQNLLFIPRTSVDFQISSGSNTIDLSGRNMYILKGESVGFKMASGGVKYNKATAGDPASENSFIYSVNSTDKLYQLQVYGAQKIFKVAFYAKIKSSSVTKLGIVDEELKKDINAVSNTVSNLTASQNIVSDNSGKKYKIIVSNGALAIRSLEYSHALVVGNSFTVHPTTSDTGAAFTTSVWWGHWAMAASTRDVAWTKLLQNALQAVTPDAVVTPIFGRPYETGYAAVDNNDAFVYWDNGTRKSLKANLASFSDVDCVVFFLGDNYTGDAWQTKFEAMYNQFATWFPSATIICMSTVTKQNVNNDIYAVANQKGAAYVDVYGIKTQAYRSRTGSYVMGDDNALHQITNGSVGGHFGDKGQLLLISKVAPALGVTPVDESHIVTLQSELLSLWQFNYLNGSVVSVFADASVTSITVTDASSTSVTATLHEDATYGKVYTFTMPNSDVTVSAATS